MTKPRSPVAGSAAGGTAHMAIASADRFVVKIGSSSLAAPDAVARLARDVVALRAAKKSVVLVSSGAIAHGYKKLGYKTRPKEMAKLQASAAAGQSHLMHAYETAFGREGIAVAQVLLTHADLADRTRSNNARDALGELLAAGAVAVLNE
ncbi:MAG TPA: glutamate 5-kinase, partial [Polyangiaceae bacterium]|nr:glutamate 5-kinase [Polyangiaceae bacterium]